MDAAVPLVRLASWGDGPDWERKPCIPIGDPSTVAKFVKPGALPASFRVFNATSGPASPAAIAVSNSPEASTLPSVACAPPSRAQPGTCSTGLAAHQALPSPVSSGARPSPKPNANANVPSKATGSTETPIGMKDTGRIAKTFCIVPRLLPNFASYPLQKLPILYPHRGSL